MDMPPEMSAEDVINYTLDRTGMGLETGNFELFSSCFALPHRLSTFEGEKLIETSKDMREVFDSVRNHLATIGGANIVRHVVTAAYRTPTQVEGVHMSHVMNGNLRIKEPYPVFSIVKWIEGQWKVAASDYAIDPEDPHAAVLIRSVVPSFTPTHSATRKSQ
jgi:hypothetical protein